MRVSGGGLSLKHYKGRSMLVKNSEIIRRQACLMQSQGVVMLRGRVYMKWGVMGGKVLAGCE